jgi:hypothetical protein
MYVEGTRLKEKLRLTVFGNRAMSRICGPTG